MSFSKSGSFSEALKEKHLDVWNACYHHPFVQELGAGTLDKECFKFYLVQDYKYLIEYARVFALGALKADTELLMTRFTQSQHAILKFEMDLHREYMRKFEIDTEEAKAVRSSLFNKAYTANMLAVAQRGGAAEILAVIFPCAWSYRDFALRLASDYPDKLNDNNYKSWIETYSSQEYLDSFTWFFDELDRLAESRLPDERAY